MTKHTKGPWIAGEAVSANTYNGELEIPIWSKTEGGKPLVALVCEIGPSDQDEFSSNARLIAAAPKILALLKRYRDETPLGHQPHMIANEVDELIAQISGVQND